MPDNKVETINFFDKLVEELPERGIFSQTLMKNEHSSVVLMQLAAGEELSEHTSKFACMIQVLEGSGKLQANGSDVKLTKGQLVSMKADLPHSVTADHDLVFVLYILKTPHK